MYYAAALELMYHKTSEEQQEKILYFLSKAIHEENLNMNQLRKVVLPHSCLTYHIRKIIKCPNCGFWTMDDFVYCQRCLSRCNSENIDPYPFLLAMCNNRCCDAYYHNLAGLPLHKRLKVRCNHLSRRPRGEYLLYIPPHAIVAEYERTNIIQEMFGLTEDEICEGVQEAENLGYHNIFYSENARDLYKGMGMLRASDAVERYLAKSTQKDEIGILSFYMKGLKQWKDYSEVHGVSWCWILE